jgi:GPH family glycoside/pentoside/hexuronide:cation symporter
MLRNRAARRYPRAVVDRAVGIRYDSAAMATEATSMPLAAGRWRLHLGWGIGTLGASILLNTFASLAPYYLNVVLGASTTLAAAVLAIAKLWDIAFNPVMGLISDRSDSRWGRRRPFLLLGAVISGGALALYLSSALTPIGQSMWLVGLALILVGTGYTVFNVPYMAMPSEMIESYEERTRMFQYRVFFIAIGTLLGVGVSQRLAELLGGGAPGYARMGLLFGLAIAFFMALTAFATAGARFTIRERHPVSFFERVGVAMRNKPFVALIGAKFLHLFGNFTAGAMMIYVVRYVMGRDEPGLWLIYFTLAALVAQIVSIPVWTRISLRIEKQKTYMLASVIYCVVSLSWLVASPAEPLWFFCLRAALKGFTASGMLLMGQSMLPDTIAYDYRRTGQRNEGVFSGLYSLVEKAASAIAPSILLLAYGFAGFDAKLPTQSAAAIEGIRYAAAFLPFLYFGLSLIPLWFYRLTQRDLEAPPQRV